MIIIYIFDKYNCYKNYIFELLNEYNNYAGIEKFMSMLNVNKPPVVGAKNVLTNIQMYLFSSSPQR